MGFHWLGGSQGDDGHPELLDDPWLQSPGLGGRSVPGANNGGTAPQSTGGFTAPTLASDAASSGLTANEQPFFQSLQDFQDLMGTFSGESLGRASRAGNTTEEYFMQLLERDPEKLMEFFGPEIASVQEQSDVALDQARKFLPRGGERDRVLSESRLRRGSDISRILSRARPEAIAGLMGLMGTSGEQGLTAGGVGVTAGSAGLQFLNQRRAIELERRSQNLGIGRDIGLSIGAMLNQFLNKGDKKGGGGIPNISTTPGATPPFFG